MPVLQKIKIISFSLVALVSVLVFVPSSFADTTCDALLQAKITETYGAGACGVFPYSSCDEGTLTYLCESNSGCSYEGNGVCDVDCFRATDEESCGNFPLQCDWGYSVCYFIGEPYCGNSIIESGEECDDGNQTEGDGCSGTCQQESGWLCWNEEMPSLCFPDNQPACCLTEGLSWCDYGIEIDKFCVTDDLCTEGGGTDECGGVSLSGMPEITGVQINSLINGLSSSLTSFLGFLVDGAALWLTLAASWIGINILRKWLRIKK